MYDSYEITRLSADRYQYSADGVVMGECSTIAEAVAELEKIQRIETEERAHDQGTAKSI